MNELELIGLDGSNPLAFLAALGTLRAATWAQPAHRFRLFWRAGDVWHPVLQIDPAMDKEALVSALDQYLRHPQGASALGIDDDLKIPAAAFRQHAAAAASAATAGDRGAADFIAAFGCDAVADEESIEGTALRTMSGAGHQHFLKSMRDLVALTTTAHLRHALFEPWRYEDEPPDLRWDPMADRRYALRWREPSGDPIRTVRGANRLAVEGVPLLPTVPTGGGLETTGFQGSGSRDTYWTWPIWECPLALDAVRALLALELLQKPQPPRPVLYAMGVSEVYRSQRLTVGKFRNFTPARPV